jgi:hypothetical protein
MGSGKNECGIIAVNLDGYISLQPCVAGAVAKTPLRWPSQVIESALSKLARSDVPKSDDFDSLSAWSACPRHCDEHGPFSVQTFYIMMTKR